MKEFSYFGFWESESYGEIALRELFKDVCEIDISEDCELMQEVANRNKQVFYIDDLKVFNDNKKPFEVIGQLSKKEKRLLKEIKGK